MIEKLKYDINEDDIVLLSSDLKIENGLKIG